MIILNIREFGKDDRLFRLEEKNYSIGRSKQNDIVLSDEHVSRSHAEIIYHPKDYSYEIQGRESATGISVNGHEIHGAIRLSHGDEILIGTTLLLVEDEGETEQETKMVSPEILEQLRSSSKLPGEDDSEEDKFQTRVIEPGDIYGAGDAAANPANETVFVNPNDIVRFIPDGYHKLVIISEKDYCKEYILDEVKFTIGRSPENKIQLEDNAVSMKHVEIRVEDDKCFIRDLRSLNGTLVAGKKIYGEKYLNDGDEIEIGSTVFKYLNRDSVISKEGLKPQSRSGGKSQKNIKIIKILLPVCAVLLVLSILKLMLTVEEKQTLPKKAKVQILTNLNNEAEPLEKASIDPELSNTKSLKKQKANLYYSTANEFMAHRLWDDAIIKFNQASEFGAHYPDIAAGIKKSEFEKENLDKMERGLSLISNKKYQQGVDILEQIPAESVYHNEVIFEIQNVLNNLKKEVKAPKKGKQNISLVAAKGDRLFAEAINNYQKGNLSLSVNKLNSILELNLPSNHSIKSKAFSLKSMILKIDNLFQRGLKDYKVQNSKDAFHTWAQVLELDKQIIDNQSSHYSKLISIYMSEEYSGRAKKYYDDGKYAEAYQCCLNALKAKPEHKSALEVRQLLSARAKQLYEEGYIIEDLNPEKALQKWKEIMTISSPDDEYHKKAKTRIAKY